MLLRWILLALAAIVVLVLLANWKRLVALWARTREFYEEIVLEMRKVAWPTQNHVVNSTVVVGVATVAMVIVIGGIDRIFGTLVELIFAAQ